MYRLGPDACVQITLDRDEDGPCDLSCGVAMSYRAFSQADERRFRSGWSAAAEGSCEERTLLLVEPYDG